jgi:hypothetical protein
MENDAFSFGNKPRMKEVPPGEEAVFRFNGKPEIVNTEYGDKYSFPITLISHDSHPLLADGPMNMDWESNSQCAKQFYLELNDKKIMNTKYGIALKAAFDNREWKLVRFDNKSYFITVKG